MKINLGIIKFEIGLLKKEERNRKWLASIIVIIVFILVFLKYYNYI